MTRPNRHRIQRQIVELAIGATGQGPAVHRELARPFWDRAVAELEKVFDEAAGPDELLRLDRLEVNLGTIGGGDWPAEFRKKLIAELTRTLAQFTAAPETAGGNGGSDSRPAEPWRQFLFFLAHGRLPWWATALAGRWSDVLARGSDADWHALRSIVFSDSRVRSRLVYSVDDAILARAIASWCGVTDADQVFARLTPPHLGADARRRWRRGFWMMVLDWVATGGVRLARGGPQLVSDLRTLRAVYEPDGEQPAASRGPSREGDGARHGRSAIDDLDLPEPWRAWAASGGETAPFERAATGTRADADLADGRAPASTSRARAPEAPRREADDEAIYLEGAGVVLVHPFLEQLFRERGLLEGRTFRGLEARARAVHLVGLLTYGRVDLPEHALVLAKLLCGAPLEEPLEPVPLDDDDVAACDAVLHAMLGHWTVLKSSSPEWLRQQFFLREGKLEAVDSGHRLTIERHAQDVLLAQLPWGFGVVALPWSDDRIFVHWLD